MKLYMHPVSMMSRPVMLYAAEQEIPLELEVVDLMQGEHHQPPFVEVNPTRLVPVLVDDDFVLTEASAILKYLAEKLNKDGYPKDLRRRARVNELMDWTNTNFYRDFGYNLCYPQVFPHHRRQSEEAQQKTLEWGAEKSRFMLGVLNDEWLNQGPWLAGPGPTIADYFLMGPITLGETIGLRYERWPRIDAWLSAMKKMKHWDEVNQTFYGFVESVKGQEYVHP